MTAHQYLTGLLLKQELQPTELGALRTFRDQIEAWLRADVGSLARFYYGGSFGKRTMLRESYDLDIILYFPPTENSTLRQIFDRVRRRLTQGNLVVVPRTVALRLPYVGGFHVDVVPGRAQDATFRYATLFKNQELPSTLQTSVKIHIESVKDAGLSDTVRLAKLWRLRHRLDVDTFPLEIAVQNAMRGVRRDDLGHAMHTVLQYLAKSFLRATLIDPANTANIIEPSVATRFAAATQAERSLGETNWNQIIR